MIANASEEMQIHAPPRIDAYLVCLVPARQGAKPLLEIRAKLPWAPFANALPPLIPLLCAQALPRPQGLKDAREALRGGFTLSKPFYQEGFTWLRVSPVEKIHLALKALGSEPPQASALPLIPLLPALYIGPGSLSPADQGGNALTLGSWSLRVFALRYLAQDPRSAFTSEMVYDRPVFKTLAHTASHFSLDNL
jgi:hypothetical protein